jgi:hypothetical protein
MLLEEVQRGYHRRLSACLGGVYAGNYWENREEGPEAVLGTPCVKLLQRMVDIFGDRWYAEIQWNNIKEQHELNQYVIQVAQELGVRLITTADSHYPNPTAWKDRELYKRLGWLGKGKPSWADEESQLPEGVEEIGYELYPKNGDQIWESYKQYSESMGLSMMMTRIMESIEETHRIAFDRIESFLPDNTVRLP